MDLLFCRIFILYLVGKDCILQTKKKKKSQVKYIYLQLF